MAAELERSCRSEQAEAVLLHYSVFSFSYRGIPIGVPALAIRLRRLGIPIVLFAHEFAYPWGRRGWRGAVHAATQRAALLPLVELATAVIVTTPERARWLRTRWWLPRRPVDFAPVFSNIRPHPSSNPASPKAGRVGLFSFGAEGLAIELVVGAVADVSRDLPDTHLTLIGAPGSESDVGHAWQRAAEAVGCPIEFTGIADEAEVSRQLSTCQLVVFGDPAGASSRKTSLAAPLAHGRAVVALTGPHNWDALIEARAVSLVAPTRSVLASELARLLRDDAERGAAERRAQAFAASHLSPDQAAHTVAQVLMTAQGSTCSSLRGRRER
jgi:hypothetical protein